MIRLSRISVLRKLAGLSLAACACASHLVHARELSPFDDYDHVAWTQKDGAPADIYSMTQTGDGWLWLGGPQGLFRFDGVHFERQDLLPANSTVSRAVKSVESTGNGDLWVLYAAGEASVRRASDPLHPLYTAGGPAGVPFDEIIEDADQVAWGMAGDGLYRLASGGWVRVDQLAIGLPATPIAFLALDRNGVFWALTSQGLYQRGPGNQQFSHADTKVLPDDQALYLDNSGHWWRILAHGLPESLTGNQLPVNGNAQPARAVGSSSLLLVDEHIRLWTIDCEGDAVCVSDLRGGSTQVDQFTRQNGLSGGPICILQDRDGNIWVSTKRGVDRFRRKAVHAVQFPEHVLYFSPVADPSGRLWTGTASSRKSNGWWDLSGQQPQQLPGFSHDLTAVWREPDGTIIVGGSDGLWRFVDGRMVSITRPTGITETRVQAIARDATGRLWVAFVHRGLFALDGTKWSRAGGIDALPAMGVKEIVSDARGRLWFGYQNNAIAVLDHGRVTQYGSADGLALGNITALSPGNPLLAGGELGLAYFDGQRFRVLHATPKDTLVGITGILRGRDHSVWINGSEGLLHVSEQELKHAMQGTGAMMSARMYDASDGMPGTAQQVRPLPTLMQGPKGKIWISTVDTLAWLDPLAIHIERRPTPVVILSLDADGTDYSLEDPIHLPPHTDTVHIAYTALNLTMPERTRFQYRLSSNDDHGDSQWQAAGSRREAIYTHLAPGHYRFTVTAINQDGIRNDLGASLELTVIPGFFQTGWFVALCALGGLILIWLAVSWQLKQVKKRLRLSMEARHAERERIARDLHDTLLQGLQGLLLRLQTWAVDKSLDTGRRSEISNVALRTRDLLVDGRDRIVALRGSGEAVDLASGLLTSGKEGEQTSDARFELIVDGDTRVLRAGYAAELLDVAREGVRNAFAHACADHIEVAIVWRPRALQVRIRDDGAGIDEAVLRDGARAGHWGLPGMRERAARIGVQFELQRREEGGTEIRLTMPARIGYVSTSSRARRYLRSIWHPPTG